MDILSKLRFPIIKKDLVRGIVLFRTFSLHWIIKLGIPLDLKFPKVEMMFLLYILTNITLKVFDRVYGTIKKRIAVINFFL